MRIKTYPVSLTLIVLFFSISLTNSQAQSNIVEFPELTGPYQVGRVNYDMVDPSRQEIFTADDNDIREFTVTVFYPASVDENSERAVYVEDTLIPAIVATTQFPASIWQALQPHAYTNADVVDGQFPVILFSHGSGIPVEAYTGLLEDLASHGYIIAGISHSYGTPVVALSDGRLLEMVDATIQEVDVLSVWVEDMLFVLDQLQELNVADPLLANHLDLSRIGAMGHSFGGATALEIAYLDARILGVINLDGTAEGAVLEYGLMQPTMIMVSDLDATRADLEAQGDTAAEIETIIETDAIERSFILQNASPGYEVILMDSTHLSYATDSLILADIFPALNTPEVVGRWDDLSGARTRIHTIILAFFNTYIAEDNSPQIHDLIFEGSDVTIFNGE